MTTDNVGLFDLDGSLANYDKAALEGLAALKSPDEPTVEDVRDALQIPHLKARLHLICREPNWWLNLQPIPMGFQMLELAKKVGFQIHVLTQGPKTKPLAWKEKVEGISMLSDCSAFKMAEKMGDAKYHLRLTLFDSIPGG
jgi:hypothetical protein